MAEQTFPTVDQFLGTLKSGDFETKRYGAPPAGTVVAVNPTAGGTSFIDPNTGEMNTKPATSLDSVKPENIATVVSLGDGAYRVVYKDGTSSDLLPGYLEEGIIGFVNNPKSEARDYVKADGTVQTEALDQSSGNFFSKMGHELGDALGDQTMRVIIPAAAIAAMAYSGYLVGAGAAAAGAGAAEGGADLAGLAGVTEAGIEGAAPAIGEVGGAAGGSAAGVAGAGGGGGLEAGIYPAVEEGLGAGAYGGLESSTGLSAAQVAQAVGKAVGSLTASDWLKAAAILGPTIAGAFANKGGQTLSSTSTSDTRPDYIKNSAEGIWNQFIDDFYGTGKGGGKSMQTRIGEDTDYLKNLDMGYIDKTKGAAAPYQQLLTDTLNQAQAGTGDFTPVSFGFGGKKMTSFVPRTNREFAAQKLGIGKEKMGVDTGLLDLENTRMREYTPNAAANKYSDALSRLMQFTSTGGQTQTQTGTVPGPSTFSNILQGLNAGTNLWGALNKYSPAQTDNGDFLTRLRTALGM